MSFACTDIIKICVAVLSTSQLLCISTITLLSFYYLSYHRRVISPPILLVLALTTVLAIPPFTLLVLFLTTVFAIPLCTTLVLPLTTVLVIPTTTLVLSLTTLIVLTLTILQLLCLILPRL